MNGSDKHNPLRVLMTADTVGGVWRYGLNLCKALQPFGVQFYLVTAGAPLQPDQKSEVAELENVTVYETGFLLEWMENPWEDIDASGAFLLNLEKEWQPHLIHLNSYAYGSLGWAAPVVVVAHSDVWSWWHCVKGGPPPAAWNTYFSRVKNGLQGAGYLVAPSQIMLRWICRIYQVDTPQQVIYNGSSADMFRPADKKPFVFSMGRIWDEAKNMTLLTEAAAQISCPVKIAGESGFAGNYSVASHSNVVLLGKLPLPQVAAQLAAASVYALPAKYEPFGLSVLEAALSGCALVLGAIDSLQEIWADSAIYVNTSDAAALAGTINLLMQNDELRLRYANKAQARAQNYTAAAMADAYWQLYRKLMHPAKMTTATGG